MKLRKLISNAGVLGIKGNPDIEISNVVSDSRKVSPGCLFIAVKGFASDGHDFIKSAIDKGAAAIVHEDDSPITDVATEAVCFVKVSSSRQAEAIIAAEFYDNPSHKLTLVGITGTNGKTTTVTLLYRLFRDLGYNCGLLSTIANYVGTQRVETTNTTSDPLTINRLLSEMLDCGCEYCFMEVSSIGMEQKRVAGLKFKAGIFSNLSHDHLDYHKTFAEYLRCKKLFFDSLDKDAFAISNIDDKNGMVMVQNCKAGLITYSCRSIADHTCRIMEESVDGMQLRIDGQEIWTRLIGQHNAYNLLAIYSTAVALGIQPLEALLSLSKLESVCGRLETIKGPRGLTIVIDYAHTPDALSNVLKTLRDISQGRQLVCLFGSGGDRDKGKRPEMAKIAELYSDRVFVTSDNCRTEKAEDIISDIRGGFSPQGLARALFISDRKEAIRTAIMISPDNSIILLAGKGHETYQIIGKESLHFDEREIVAEVFDSLKF